MMFFQIFRRESGKADKTPSQKAFKEPLDYNYEKTSKSFDTSVVILEFMW